MSRIRLTQRMAAKNRNADKADPETAIDLGKNRTYHEMDEYYTYDIECEAPNNDHGWKKNPRESTGHGIPKDARVYMAAKKATKLAMMFLGTNASDAVIEAQARSFMRMGDSALTASIDRWAGCQNGKCDETTPAESTAEAPAESTAAVNEPTACPNAAEGAAGVEGGKKDDEAAPAAPAEVPAKAPATDGEGEATPAPAPEGKGEGDIDIKEIKDEGDVSFDEEEETPNEDTDDATEMAMLASIFAGDDDKEPTETPAPTVSTTASKKEGVKRLCGQPTLTRVASVKSDDLTSLWDKWSNPTVIR